MSAKVVYEKHYSYEEPTEDVIEKLVDLKEADGEPFDVFYEKLTRSLTFVEILERKESCQQFIAAAIKAAEVGLMDVKIQQHDTRISVRYSFECGMAMKCLKPVFILADDYGFFTGKTEHEIVIVLDYYTHTIYRNGRAVFP